ncbi:MAG: peptide ABC transporter substrate-binding protein [Alkalinema sp. CACIAM 70d]|nr:MAG: peptide ABC transporter substrate-binding protein [Alkalinema sp. CACIAM 70d]
MNRRSSPTRGPITLQSLLTKLGLFFCACLLIVSCSASQPGKPAATNPTDYGRITLGTTANISTIDPADAYSSFEGVLLYNLSDRLYTYKLGTRELMPQLATSFPKVSADGLTYTIPLRQGVVFHDGTAFDAAAMAFSLERFMKNGGSPSFLLSDAIDQVKATAPYELTIKLKKPFAAFPALLAFSGACAVSPKAYTIKEGEFKPKEIVGTGPYKLVEFNVDRLRLEPFEQYWGGKPSNAGIDVQIFSSPANLYNAFRTGAVDLATQSLAIEQIRNLKDSVAQKHWQIIEQAGSGIDYLTINLTSSPLDQKAVRQAIAALVDRSLLQSRIFEQQVDPLYSLIPATLAEHVPTFKTQYGDRNIEKAKDLLQKAGFSAQNPLKVELWYRSNVTNDQLSVVTLKALAKKTMAGMLELQLNGVESVTAYNNLDKGAYPMMLLDWSPDYIDADSYIQPFLDCTKGDAKTGCSEGQSVLQGSFYYNDRANQLLAQSRQELNPAKRQQLFAELQTIVAEDVPFIPLWQSKDFLFVQQEILGASLEATQKIPFWKLQRSTATYPPT